MMIKETNGLNAVICADIPEHITYEQAVRAVIRYADTHSEETHLTFTVLAMVALEKAWPCK